MSLYTPLLFFSALIPWLGEKGRERAEKPGTSASLDESGSVQGQAGIPARHTTKALRVWMKTRSWKD